MVSTLATIYPRDAKRIYAGETRMDVRKRFYNDPVANGGDTIIFYERGPVSAITGYALVDYIYEAAPDQIWREFGDMLAMNHEEFFSYISGVGVAFALFLKGIKKLKRPIPRMEMRDIFSIKPPPTYCFIGVDIAEYIFSCAVCEEGVNEKVG